MDQTLKSPNVNSFGDQLEPILFRYLKNNGLDDFESGPPNDSPDYFGSDRAFRFELKVFGGSPGFDINNIRGLFDAMALPGGVLARMFSTKYIVFEYTANDEDIRIKKLFYTDIWKLTSYTGIHPLSLQMKKGQIYNLRPSTHSSWDDSDRTPRRFVESIIRVIEPLSIINKDAKIESITRQFDEISQQYAL